MYYRLAAGARLFRVTGPSAVWPNPLLGLGAYYTKGGRYNRAGDATVYCSEDALAVIAEMAFYQALEWQFLISAHWFHNVNYPLESEHRLWCFSIDPAPAILDLEDAATVHQFQYPPHLLLNPSLNPRRGLQLPGQLPARDYLGTQELADEIRAYLPPPGSPHPRPEGVRAPAVRMKKTHNYQPKQLALFVFPPAVHVPYDQRSVLIAQWGLQLRFLQVSPRAAVTAQTADIDWCKPQFRLSGHGAPAIPAYVARPGAMAYTPNRWYNVKIQYA